MHMDNTNCVDMLHTTMSSKTPPCAIDHLTVTPTNWDDQRPDEHETDDETNTEEKTD